MGTRTWFRKYNDTPDDEKIELVAMKSGQPWAVVYALWDILLCMASKTDAGGWLLIAGQPMEALILARKAHLELATVEMLLQHFMDLGMVEQREDGAFFLSKFAERQYESDISTPRVQKFRAKQVAEQPVVEAETLHETTVINEGPAMGNVSETTTETETDSESDTELKDSLSVFARDFLKIAGMEKFPKGTESQVAILDRLIRENGAEKSLSCWTWLWSKKDMSMKRAISSMQTAVPGWTVGVDQGKTGGERQARAAPAGTAGRYQKPKTAHEQMMEMLRG
jgi:hypothetical protein